MRRDMHDSLPNVGRNDGHSDDGADVSAPTFTPFAGVEPDDYTTPPDNPRWDPTFVDRCLDDLTDHRGQWRRLGRLHAAECPSFDRCCAVRDAVDWGLKLGMIIEAERGRGYRFTGNRHPERLYTCKPGAPARCEPEAQVAGQLTLVAEV